VRRNAALAYLTPEVRSRPNLAVVGGSRVRRVLLPQGRATGVTGDAGTFLAGEVVLAAGALETPRILFGSGIGPRGVLEGLGIPVVRHLPAVGAGFGDHPQLVLEWEPAAGLPAPELSWLGGCVRAGGYEILQSLVPLPSLGGGAEQPRGGPLAFLLSDLTPRRTGVVRPLPDGGLRVEYGYLTSAAGRRVLREGVRATAALLDAEPLAALSRRPGVLGLSPAVRADDAALDAWIRERLGTAQHTCGTVPMGPEDAPQRAAVDQFGRVHGLRGLRVADTSILPLPPRRGPAATAVLVGERLARAVRDGL
jgi:choline dehydrogenase-like flavoprotein